MYTDLRPFIIVSVNIHPFYGREFQNVATENTHTHVLSLVLLRDLTEDYSREIVLSDGSGELLQRGQGGARSSGGKQS